jgi:hypothetical protein
MSGEQWHEFLAWLSRISLRFEIVVFGRDCWGVEPVPPNVRVDVRGFAPTEKNVMDSLRSLDVDFGYVGIWSEPDMSLFARTSFSSKTVTLAAAGLPLVVHAPPDSPVAEMVRRYEAGVVCPLHAPAGSADIRHIVSDGEYNTRCGANALRMCREQFDLATNAQVLARELMRTAALAGCATAIA